jgi:putative ABC transport system substrate-binding protein
MPVSIGRRELIAALAGAAAWPLAADSQELLPVIGYLTVYSLDQSGQRLLAAFREGLRETGFDEGRNVRIKHVSAEGDYTRLPGLAADLVRDGVQVIAAVGGSPAVRAAKQATALIPVVFQIGVDPIQFGFVESLNRPGANVTGIVNRSLEIGQKRLEVLHELLPKTMNIGVLVNPANPSAQTQIDDLKTAAGILGLRIHLLQASSDTQLEAAFAELRQVGVPALVISGDPFFNSRSGRLARLAARDAIPAAYQFREFVQAGGLVSYGSSLTYAHRLTGIYTGRILNHEHPRDLPVQQSTHIELIVNLNVAKALGITVPLSLLGRADEVIE